jgi:hypothetical protein
MKQFACSSGITSSSYKENSTTIDLVLNKVEQTAVALDVCFRYGRFRLGSRFMLAHAASQLELGAIQLLWCQFGIGLSLYISFASRRPDALRSPFSYVDIAF